MKKKKRRKHKRRYRITPRGFLVFGLTAVVVGLLLFLLVRICIVYFHLDEKKSVDGASADPSGTSALADGDEALPEAVDTPYQTPTPVPSPTPQLASTGSRLPTDAEVAGAVDGIVRTSNIAMRKGPNKSYDIVKKYNVGERVRVFAVEGDYTFVQVIGDERYGFIATEFVTRFGLLPDEAASNTPVPAAVAGTVMGLVNVDEVKLRSKPSTSGNTPLAVCKNHEVVWIFLQTGEFYYVQCAATGQTGYVFAEYIMTQAPVPTGTPVPG